MKNILILFALFAAICLSGCGTVRVAEEADSAKAAISAQLEASKADAEFSKTEANTWKASDARKAQQLADAGKTIAQLNAAVTKTKQENADGAVRLDQEQSDLKLAIIARDRFEAAIIAGLALAIGVIAFSVSEYFTTFAWILRPIAYGAAGIAVAAFIFREVRPYAAPIEAVLGFALLLTAFYELDIHTPLGKLVGWLLGKAKAEAAPVVAKIEAEIKKI